MLYILSVLYENANLNKKMNYHVSSVKHLGKIVEY